MCPCQVCTEARDATKNAKKKRPKAKTRPGKKGTKARRGCVSGSANVPVCGYKYIYINISIYLFTNHSKHSDIRENDEGMKQHCIFIVATSCSIVLLASAGEIMPTPFPFCCCCWK